VSSCNCLLTTSIGFNPAQLPRPKFRFGQEVEYVLDDFDGSVLVERGVVIGMNYESSD